MKIDYIENEGMFVNQSHYIKSLVEDYGLEDGKLNVPDPTSRLGISISRRCWT